jgi:hypothetical protein
MSKTCGAKELASRVADVLRAHPAWTIDEALAEMRSRREFTMGQWRWFIAAVRRELGGRRG